MSNLDRFSQPMSWEWEPEHPGRVEIERQEPSCLCACGCKQEIDLDDESSYCESIIFEQYLIAEPEHINAYAKKNDQLVGSQSN